MLGEEIVKKLGNKNRFIDVKFGHHGARRKDYNGNFIGYVSFNPASASNINISVMNIFSLDGTSSLIWSYIVTTFFRRTLTDIFNDNQPRLLVGEFDIEFPERRICDLSELKFLSHSICVDIELSPFRTEP